MRKGSFRCYTVKGPLYYSEQSLLTARNYQVFAYVLQEIREEACFPCLEINNLRRVEKLREKHVEVIMRKTLKFCKDSLLYFGNGVFCFFKKTREDGIQIKAEAPKGTRNFFFTGTRGG